MRYLPPISSPQSSREVSTAHQDRIETFMELAGQEVPRTPTEPSEAVRLLRAKLIFEECMETITALGVCVELRGDDVCFGVADAAPNFTVFKPLDMVEAVDGCLDISVVTIGTLSALGVADKPLLELVDQNNLGKFDPGHSFREDGKLVKPPGHKPPDIEAELIRQGWAKPAEPDMTLPAWAAGDDQ